MKTSLKWDVGFFLFVLFCYVLCFFESDILYFPVHFVEKKYETYIKKYHEFYLFIYHKSVFRTKLMTNDSPATSPKRGKFCSLEFDIAQH